MLKLCKSVCLGYEISRQKCHAFRLCLSKGLIHILTHMGRALRVVTKTEAVGRPGYQFNSLCDQSIRATALCG